VVAVQKLQVNQHKAATATRLLSVRLFLLSAAVAAVQQLLRLTVDLAVLVAALTHQVAAALEPLEKEAPEAQPIAQPVAAVAVRAL
jgi:hypothetical protein